MMRSMFTGVAGLRTHQTKMDVIGNNIANVNTAGYKSSAVTFKEIFSQTIQGASQANADTGRGGTNPLQIGLGVSVASIDSVMTQGAAQVTDNPLDLMINGNSFFIVGDNSGQYFTRAGSFRLDAQGNLVNPAGLRVYGWSTVEDVEAPGGVRINKGRVEPLVIKSQENMFALPEATQNISFSGNLSADIGKNEDIVRSIDFYDTLGNNYKVDVTFTFVPGATADSGYWRFNPADKMTRNGSEELDFKWSHADCELRFDEHGKLVSVDGDTENLFIEFDILSDLGIDAKTNDGIKLRFDGVTQFVGQTSIKGESMDGRVAGELTGFSIGPDGIITGIYSNGSMRPLGQIAVANFKNPMGLERVGDNLFTATANSGGFDGIGDDPTSGGGSIGGGRLEMSNVDLSREFTEMITTQRGFQANAKTITTSDEMLQELVRLK